MLALLAFSAPGWLLGILAFDRWYQVGPQLGWPWLIGGWLVLLSAPGRAVIVLSARRLLLADLRPGRHPRHGWLAYRLWFVERLAELCHLQALAGTPWATRYARISGHRVGRGARLGTLPPPTSLLMPGASIGAHAEVEPGALVAGDVPAGQRWAGSPARWIGDAGDGWPQPLPGVEHVRLRAKAMYAVGLFVQSTLPLVASLPAIAILTLISGTHVSAASLAVTSIALAPLLALSFVLAYALLVALVVRATAPLIKPGWHRDHAPAGWALWLTENVMAGTRGALFPLYASVYTLPWLRLLGIRVGRRTEISTAVGLNRLTSFGRYSFATDDVVLSSAQARGGWLYVAPIEVGDGSFIGNSAILQASTRLGDDSLLGVLSVAPRFSANGTSWFGSPALELPLIADRADPSRTTDPPARLILARGAVELVRILLPTSTSTVLAAVVFWGLSAVGASSGIWTMAAAAPILLAGAAACATLLTVGIKWMLIGRYQPGEHPFWSSFVWRDEIVNTCQEQLAGGWLLRTATATPLVSLYLRMMGAKVGRDVWCETLNLTEFDVVELGDGCVVNRHAVVETHLFHDRLMRIGPATLAAGATLGPAAATLPDTTIGNGSTVGGRSVVMRGELLPAHTRWHGAPVVAV